MRVLVVVGVVAYGVWRGTALVLGAPALQITRIEVRGNDRLSTGEVLALADGIQDRNILTAPLGRWRERILSSPWVKQATLRRVLPSTIEIAIRERRPMGIGRLGKGLYLVDGRGLIVDEFGPKYADLDLPVVDGLAGQPAGGSLAVDQVRAVLAAGLIAALEPRPDLGRRVSQIDVSDAHDAVVMLEHDTTMLRLGDRDFVDRLQAYLDFGPALRQRIPEIDYVDLRFDERIYVRPAAGPGGK